MSSRSRPVTLPRKSILRLDLFDPSNIPGDGLSNALSECESILTEKNFEYVVEDLFSKPNLIELVISGKSNFSVDNVEVF